MTEAEDIERVSRELLESIKGIGEQVREPLRASIGHDLEFVILAWDAARTHRDGSVSAAYHVYAIRPQDDALRIAKKLIEEQLAKSAAASGTAGPLKLH